MFIVLSTNAYTIQQCDLTSKAEVSYETDDLKVTFIQGDIAKQAWNQITVAMTEPKPGTGDHGYNAKAKYSENLNCWNYQPRKYVNGIEVGPSDCEVYSCNVIERK